MYLVLTKQGFIIDCDKSLELFAKKLLQEEFIRGKNWVEFIDVKYKKFLMDSLCQDINESSNRVFIFYKIRPSTRHKNDCICILHHGMTVSLGYDDIRHISFLFPILEEWHTGLGISNERIPFIQFFSDNPLGCVIFQQDKVCFCNKVALNLLELRKDESRRLSFSGLFDSSITELIKEHLLKQGKYEFTFQYTSPHSIKKWFKSFISTINTDNERLFSMFFYDITDMANKEEQLSIFKYIVDNAGNEFYLVHPDGRFAYVNEASARSLGYDLATFRNLSVPEIDVNYNPEKFKSHFDSLKNGNNDPFITIHRHRDGHLVEKEIKTVYLKVGENEYVYGFGQDITQRRKLEKYLEREHLFARSLLKIAQEHSTSSVELLRKLLHKLIEVTNAVSVCLISAHFGKNIFSRDVADRHKTVVWTSEISDRLRKIVEDEIERFFQLPDNVLRFTPFLKKQFHIGESHSFETLYMGFIPIKSQTEVRDILVISRLDNEFSDDELSQLFFFCNASGDIVRKLQAEENLLRREKILETASRFASMLLRHRNWEEDIHEILRALGETTGVSRTYIFRKRVTAEGRILVDQLYEWVAPGIIPQIDNPILQGFDMIGEGYERWVQLLSQDQPIFGCVKDLPPPERAHLQSQEILSIAIMPIIVFGEWWGLIGFDDCVTERFWNAHELHALKLTAEMISAAIERKMEEEIIREQQEYLQITEKFSSLGIMASGIAHEVNNPLSIISLATQHLFAEFSNPKNEQERKLYELIEKIQKNVNRIKKITNDLKILAKEDVNLPFQIIPLQSIVNEVLELTSARMEKLNIQLSYKNDCQDEMVRVIPTLFTQVIVNLLNNAMDAVEQVEKPEIHLNIKDLGDYIQIEVEDNGCGVPEENRTKILNPFFTTKEVGKGMGLGLPLSKSIMDLHNGELSLDSSTKNTRFLIRLKKIIRREEEHERAKVSHHIYP